MSGRAHTPLLRLAFLLPALFVPALESRAQSTQSDPRRQFDFWVGEWDVLNRFHREEGWVDGDRTRARITPVVAGNALLEEWAGPLHGGFMNGFSLRSWNADVGRWEILLFWTMTGSGGFGSPMRGTFRHGRGEFFSNEAGLDRTRYTFSDALPETVRWDSAKTTDGGRTWHTDWIMEFARTRPAGQVTLERFFAEDWNPGELSPHTEARALDWLIGTWEGVQTDAEGSEREARLRCKTISKDCLLVDVLETRAVAGGSDAAWRSRLCVRGWTMPTRRWQSWRCSEADPSLRRTMQTSVTDERAAFEGAAGSPNRGKTLRETLVRLGEGHAVIEEELVEGGVPTLLRLTELQRVE